MAKKDKPKNAFISHRGQWQFKRLPMGLMNTPTTFVRCIDEILGDLKWVCVLGYFDDIIVFSKSFDEHCEHIRLVLERLRTAGFTIHPNKVQLCRTRLKFLGFIVDSGKCFPNPEKVICINNYPTPNSAHGIQKFLGLIGFYRRFIPDVAIHAKPLFELLKKKIKFVWTDRTQEAFDFLKKSLSSLSELHLPDLNLPFIISCDASTVGLGAILQQEKDGIRYPIWFLSRSLKLAETRYSASELELLAVIWAVERFRGFI